MAALALTLGSALAQDQERKVRPIPGMPGGFMLGGSDKNPTPEELKPPQTSFRSPCANDGDNDRLQQEYESWRSLYTADQQADAELTRAGIEVRDALDDEDRARREHAAAKEAQETARIALASARSQGGALIQVQNRLEAAIKRFVETRKALADAHQRSNRTDRALKEKYHAYRKVHDLLIAARIRYLVHEERLRKTCPPQAAPQAPEIIPALLPPGYPRTVSSRWDGVDIGAYASLGIGNVDFTEHFAATNVQTNAFSDSGNGAGGGFTLGYNRLINGRITLGAVVNLTAQNAEARHTFPPTPFYISSTQNFSADILGRVGFVAAPNLLLYGQGGVTVANNRLQIDFGGVRTDESQTTVAAAAGGGAEIALPSNLVGNVGEPSIFIDYLHKFNSTARLDRPAASPAFIYDFTRNDDQVKLGFRIRIKSEPAPHKRGDRL